MAPSKKELPPAVQGRGEIADGRRVVRRLRFPLLLALLALALPAGAEAADEPVAGGVTAPKEAPTQAGGGSYGQPSPAKKRKRRRGTVLTAFELRRKHLYLYGRAARIRFTLSGRKAVRMRLYVLRAADRAKVATLDLGVRRAGEHSLPFTGLEAGVLPEGSYLLHIAGRGLRRASTASSTAALEFSHHVFPIAGAFSWGNEGSRFGAKREGHSHQGQDLAAAEGTPVVAPRGGVVEAVGYQARGAGHYVIVDGEGEDYDYAFMHLQTGSIPVKQGDQVRTGQLIGLVGTTGRSSGPHLHFEIWVGGWYAGGQPIDPLPLLQVWAA
jgi:murein DD-endopeptidase MepM/ murein hydrolase activator NlpD